MANSLLPGHGDEPVTYRVSPTMGGRWRARQYRWWETRGLGQVGYVARTGYYATRDRAEAAIERWKALPTPPAPGDERGAA